MYYEKQDNKYVITYFEVAILHWRINSKLILNEIKMFWYTQKVLRLQSHVCFSYRHFTP